MYKTEENSQWRRYWLNNPLAKITSDWTRIISDFLNFIFSRTLKTFLDFKPNSFNSKTVADSWIVVSLWWPLTSIWRSSNNAPVVMTDLRRDNNQRNQCTCSLYKSQAYSTLLVVFPLPHCWAHGLTVTPLWTMISDEDQRHPLTRFPLPVRI